MCQLLFRNTDSGISYFKFYSYLLIVFSYNCCINIYFALFGKLDYFMCEIPLYLTQTNRITKGENIFIKIIEL